MLILKIPDAEYWDISLPLDEKTNQLILKIPDTENSSWDITLIPYPWAANGLILRCLFTFRANAGIASFMFWKCTCIYMDKPTTVFVNNTKLSAFGQQVQSNIIAWLYTLHYAGMGSWCCECRSHQFILSRVSVYVGYGCVWPPATHLAKGYVRFTVRERGERENW